MDNRPTSDKAARGKKGGRGHCRACGSEHQTEIDSAIVAGVSYRELEKRFGISKTALIRHKRDHLTPALVKVERNARIDSAATLIGDLRLLADQARAILSAAVDAKNGSQALAAIREARATLELIGRATGELKERPAVSVNLQTAPEWIAIRTAMVEMLAPHPELGRQLAKRLKVIEGGRS